ncbi:MAG: alpha-2-macroglobulin [Chloroflexi bacterium]|nr:alpha-2-macroglobulin [Chloroflexota bacterium]
MSYLKSKPPHFFDRLFYTISRPLFSPGMPQPRLKGKTLAVIVVLALAMFASLVLACVAVDAPKSYMAVMPRVMASGSQAAVSLTLLNNDRLGRDNVAVTLLQQGKEILSASQSINGKGTIALDLPKLPEGDYEIKVKGTSFEGKAQVRIENNFLVFLETDKPIYKPGQTIHIRAMLLDAELKPVSEAVTIEALDAKGIKIFRSETRTDEFGMAGLDLPISNEPNLGTWKLTALSGKAKTQLDVKVEKYVLPKYEVKLDLAKDWFLVNEAIPGKVAAEYSFGKPVQGELEIKASRYVGEWRQFAVVTKAIDGETDFSLPAVGYVAGTPAGGGMGNVMLDVVVREKSTGYEEKTNRLLTIAQTPLRIQLIPESAVFKPGLPFNFLLITETPDNKPVETTVKLHLSFLGNEFQEVGQADKEVKTVKGKALIEVTPPEKSVSLTAQVDAEGASATKTITASYSPSGNFIQLEQISEGTPQIGEEIRFQVHSTKQAANFYYEVIGRGKVVFSDFTKSREIAITATPLMAPTAKLLVYQVLPNSEVAADYLSFNVDAQYPQAVKAGFSTAEAAPGEEVNVNVETEGVAKVGIAVVDKSVFILAENRLNLKQVFDELEKLYMKPQAEIHEANFLPVITTKGAADIFKDAGVVVLSNSDIPGGKEYQSSRGRLFGGIAMAEKGAPPPMTALATPVPMPVPAPAAPQMSTADQSAGLAEVQRVRQFFPETWLWQDIVTDASGKGSFKVAVPDSITTWMLRAVAISKSKGLGVAEGQLKAFQPFFVTVDLPYSAIRGEEFPVSVAIYNYLDQPQSVQVDIERADWFDLLDDTTKKLDIGPNDIGGASFKIRPKKLGFNDVKITARSPKAADAIIKKLIVEPEGVSREVVENLVLSAGKPVKVDTTIPFDVVVDSGRAYLAVTASFLTQTLEGLEGLIQMPFGCGEQNMILFAPDVFITKYLQTSGQLKPEIMAKAEKLMITGYQRELTYRRSDGSFSAFGQNDKEGSLWLTAFVLKSFAQAKGLIYIDDNILDQARAWITAHQNKDGSFDVVGFVAHQEMMGGLSGKDALTAYVALALLEAGERTSSGRAVAYLEGRLNGMDDPYTLAITTYALELAQSGKKDEAYQKLMKLAQEDENGLHWGSGNDIQPLKPGQPQLMRYPVMPNRSAEIETTAYATLALIQHKDAFNASRAAKWLVSRRNAYGGFGSTQDTVVALQALTEYSSGARADVDLTINVKASGLDKTLRLTPQNFDVLQVVELPVNSDVDIEVAGKGEAIAQVVKRFNLPEVEAKEEILKIDVRYDVTEVAVNDLVTVAVSLAFNPPVPMEAGMVVLDVSVPTGFAPVTESIDKAIKGDARLKRYEVAGRKVIFYVENMQQGDKVAFTFTVRAMYPVKAKGVTSQAYAYYQPEIKGETLSRAVTVR